MGGGRRFQTLSDRGGHRFHTPFDGGGRRFHTPSDGGGHRFRTPSDRGVIDSRPTPYHLVVAPLVIINDTPLRATILGMRMNLDGQGLRSNVKVTVENNVISCLIL